MRLKAEVFSFLKLFTICRYHVLFGQNLVAVAVTRKTLRGEFSKTINPRSSRSAQNRIILKALQNRKKFTVAGLTVTVEMEVLSEGFSPKRRKAHRPDIFTPGQKCWHFPKGS